MTAPTTQQATGSALQVWTPSAVQQLIASYPEEQFIALFPRTVLSQVNPMLSPVVETVVLNPDPENGGDVYTSKDIGRDSVALTKVALRRVMQLAGASMVDSRRMDDGSDPYYVLWQVTVERQVPGRPKPERAIGTKEIRLGPEQVKGWTPERTAKAREHMTRMAEAKACNAALRDLLTLKQKYTLAEIRKPFVILRWEPNMSHPAVEQRFLDNLLPASVAAYGQAPDTAQLQQGEQPYELAPHVPDDDDDSVHEGSYVEVHDNGGHQTVATATGEVVGQRRPAPDLGMGGDDDFGSAPAPARAPAPQPEVPLKDRILALLAEREAHDGPLEQPTREMIQALMRPIKDHIGAGTQAVYGLSAAQFQQRHGEAMLAAAEAVGDERFRREWVAMATAKAGGS